MGGWSGGSGKTRPARGPPSAWKRRERDSEYGSLTIAFVIQLALVLTDNPIGHEEAESRSSLFRREMRLEQVMAILVGDAGTVVGDAEVRPSVGTPTCGEFHMSMLRHRVDGVVGEVGGGFAEQ